MKYYPLHKAPEEILVEAGFTRDFNGAWGWAKALLTRKQLKLQSRRHPTILYRAEELSTLGKPQPERRLHAFTHHGYIEIHEDHSVSPTKHIATAHSHAVKDAVRHFELIDVAPAAADQELPTIEL